MSAIGAFLRGLWPQRLAGQMIALLLLALVLAQVVALVIFADERTTAIRTVERKQILERTASVLRLIESTPPAVHEQIVRTASSWHLRFWLAPASAVRDTVSGAGSEIRARLETLLDDTADPREILVEFRDDDGWWQGERDPPRAQRMRSAARAEEPVVLAVREQRRWLAGNRPRLLISARLDDGRWLNAGLRVRTPLPPWALPPLPPLGLTAIALCAIVMLTVRRITRPLERLASAAERVGRGETIPPIAEEGPLDVRQTTAAFNRMRERLQRFVQDRTRMLAAISHDLRTPITSLRLRAEFVDDEETRQKILETLDEMQRMTEATLVFAREEATREDTRTVDLAALVESLCLDLADMGMDVAFAGPGRMPYDCRPLGLKRAVRNLVENAVRYGQRARVVLAPAPDGLEIVIDDDGPGIPESDFERLFAPFVRLEESRSRETGGIGLGMAIARSIVRGHGGDIALANREDGGLRVTVRLPKTERH